MRRFAVNPVFLFAVVMTAWTGWVIDGSGELLTTVPRNSTGEISRFKAYGTRHSH
jgi:hypothetical protein